MSPSLDCCAFNQRYSDNVIDEIAYIQSILARLRNDWLIIFSSGLYEADLFINLLKLFMLLQCVSLTFCLCNFFIDILKSLIRQFTFSIVTQVIQASIFL